MNPYIKGGIMFVNVFFIALTMLFFYRRRYEKLKNISYIVVATPIGHMLSPVLRFFGSF